MVSLQNLVSSSISKQFENKIVTSAQFHFSTTLDYPLDGNSNVHSVPNVKIWVILTDPKSNKKIYTGAAESLV